MGVLLQADCSACGYGVQVLAGFGMAGVGYEPRICLDCREIVAVAVTDVLNRLGPNELGHCPDCGGKNVQAFSYEQPDDEIEPSPRSNPCPKCGSPLNVREAGDWD